MVDGEKLIKFIGHASVNSPLDDFLIMNNMKLRPKGNSGHYEVGEKTFGLDFQYREYDDYTDNYFIPSKSKGKFILQDVIFRRKIIAKGWIPFAGKYPFGVDERTKPDDILKKFGKPRKFSEGGDGSSETYVYSSEMLVFSFGFNHQTKELDFVKARVADKHDRKHGLID